MGTMTCTNGMQNVVYTNMRSGMYDAMNKRMHDIAHNDGRNSMHTNLYTDASPIACLAWPFSSSSSSR